MQSKSPSMAFLFLPKNNYYYYAFATVATMPIYRHLPFTAHCLSPERFSAVNHLSLSRSYAYAFISPQICTICNRFFNSAVVHRGAHTHTPMHTTM